MGFTAHCPIGNYSGLRLKPRLRLRSRVLRTPSACGDWRSPRRS